MREKRFFGDTNSSRGKGQQLVKENHLEFRMSVTDLFQIISFYGYKAHLLNLYCPWKTESKLSPFLQEYLIRDSKNRKCFLEQTILILHSLVDSLNGLTKYPQIFWAILHFNRSGLFYNDGNVIRMIDNLFKYGLPK